MAISKPVAQKLCTKLEFALVEASFPPGIKSFTLTKIKTKVASAQKYLDKWKDLQKKQERELSGQQASGKKVPLSPIEGTKKKIQLFSETIDRFTKQMVQLQASDAKDAKSTKNAKEATITANKTTKKVQRSATTVAPKPKRVCARKAAAQQATIKETKTTAATAKKAATKKIEPEAVMSKPVELKKELKKAKALPAKAVAMPKVLGSKGKGKHDVPALKKQFAQAKKISSHTRAATKRNQAKRDRR